jgi:hypothetical protein
MHVLAGYSCVHEIAAVSIGYAQPPLSVPAKTVAAALRHPMENERVHLPTCHRVAWDSSAFPRFLATLKPRLFFVPFCTSLRVETIASSNLTTT